MMGVSLKGTVYLVGAGVSLVPKGPVAPLLGLKGSDLSAVPVTCSPLHSFPGPPPPLPMYVKFLPPLLVRFPPLPVSPTRLAP